MINWNLLQPVDVGAQVEQGFKTGAALVQKVQETNALRAYMAAPEDPQAFNQLYMANPQIAQNLEDRRSRQQEQQQRAAQQQMEARREDYIKGAQIIREINPTDEATWQQALQVAAQSGVNLEGVPQQFDPNYVQTIVKAADALAPRKAAELPSIAREVEYYRSIGRPDLAERRMERHAEGPPIAVRNDDGTVTLIDPGMAAGGSRPAPAPAAGAAPPPPPPPGFQLDGGPTVAPSGGFPR